jgi:hypothetical protein
MVLVVRATLPVDLSGTFPVYLQWSLQCCQCIFPGNMILCSQGNLNQSQFLRFLVMWHIHHVFRLCRWHISGLLWPQIIFWVKSLCGSQEHHCAFGEWFRLPSHRPFLWPSQNASLITSVLWNPNIPPTQFPTPFPTSWLEDFGSYASILEVWKVVGDWLHLPIYQKILHWLIQLMVLLLFRLLFGQREAASNLVNDWSRCLEIKYRGACFK